MTQIGTSIESMTPAENRASVMMPIVFWASLEPWAKAMNPAEKIWSRRKIVRERLAVACRGRST